MLGKIISKFAKLHPNVYVVSGTLFINTVFYFSWYPVLPIHLRALGADDIAIGFIYFVLSFSFTLFQFLGGILADKFSLKKIIVATTLLGIPAYIGAGLSHNWIIFAVFVFCFEVFNAIQWPAFMLSISEFSSKKELGFAYSVFEASIILSFTAGPALGFMLMPFVSVPYLIIFSGLICIFTAVIRLFFLNDHVNKRSEGFNFAAFSGFFNFKFFISFLIFGMFALIIMLTSYGPFIAIYCKDVFNFTERKIQFIMFIGNLFAGMFSFVAGYMVDKHGSKLMMGLGLFMQAIFFIFWIKCPGGAGVYIYFVLSIIFLQIAAVAKNKLLIEIAPESSRGLFMGLLFALSGVLGSLSPLAASYAKKIYGIYAPFYINFIFGTLAVILIILYINLKDRKKR